MSPHNNVIRELPAAANLTLRSRSKLEIQMAISYLLPLGFPLNGLA
jgi:hypothetical protein